jgi:hypothetical protein
LLSLLIRSNHAHATCSRRDDELGTSQFAGAELQAQLAQAKAAAEAAQESEAAALAARDRAIGALDGAKAEAAKAAANAERHQEASALAGLDCWLLSAIMLVELSGHGAGK